MKRSALISLFLLSTFTPILGYGTLVTTGVGGVFGAVLALYGLSIFLEAPTNKNLLFAGIAFGLAQVCKISNIMLIPVFLIAINRNEASL